MGFGGASFGPGVEWIFALHDLKRCSRCGYITGKRTGVVAEPVEWMDASDTGESACGEDADEAVVGCRLADGVGGVGSGAEDGEISRDGCGCSAG